MWQITGVDPNYSEEGRGTIREVEGNRAEAILAGCEAAAVDGCGLVLTFVRIVFPLLKPATATLAIFIILQVWNDLILPLILLSSNDKQTVTLAVYATIGTHMMSTAQLLPTLVLGVVPLFVVFLLLQRYVVAGIAVGAGK